MEPRISIITLGVSDLARSVRFYRDGLGLPLRGDDSDVIVKPAKDTDWGGYSGYFTDHNGYLWEVAWNPHFLIE